MANKRLRYPLLLLAFFLLSVFVVSVLFLRQSVSSLAPLTVKRPDIPAQISKHTVRINLEGQGLTADLRVSLVRNSRLEKAPIGPAYPIPGVFNVSLVHQQILYLGSVSNGLTLIDIHDPQRPRLLETYLQPRSIVDIHQAEDKLFLSCGLGGVVIMRITAAGHLELLTEIKTPGAALKARPLKTNRLAVAVGTQGVLFYDLSRSERDDGHRIDCPAPDMNFEIKQGFLYLLSGQGEVSVYHIDGGTGPRMTWKFRLPGGPGDMLIHQSDLLLTQSSGLYRYGLSDPARPTLLAHREVIGSMGRIVAGVDRFYLRDNFVSIYAVDHDLKEPLGLFVKGKNIRTLAESGDYLYVTGSDTGLLVFDRQTFYQDDSLTIHQTPGTAFDLVMRDQVMYVAAGEGGLIWKDLRRPRIPAIQLSPFNTHFLCLDNNYLYALPHKRGAIEIFDLSEPRRPKKIMEWADLGASRLAVDGHYAALSKGAHGLELYDIKQLNQPQLRDRLPDVHVLDVVFKEHLLCLATRNQGLILYHVGADGRLRLQGRIALPFPMNEFTQTVALAVRDDLAYVAGGPAGLLIIDIADPQKMKILSLLPIAGFSKGILLSGNRVLIGSQEHEISVIDVTDPTIPRLEGVLRVQMLARGMQLQDDLIYVAGKRHGVSVVPMPLKAEQLDFLSSEKIRVHLRQINYRGCYDLQISNRYQSIRHETVICSEPEDESSGAGSTVAGR